MPYSNFTLKKVKSDFKLTVVEDQVLFSGIEEIRISPGLLEILKYNVPLALAINTEKARSELIVTNILVEVKKISGNRVSLFSGISFDVDKKRDLTGFCDYIVSKSPEQLYLSSPIIAVVEAKNENILGGLGQCIAEMIASKIFNENEGNRTEKVYGVVTSGNAWKFLKYENETIYIDLEEYYIKNPGKIIGILLEMVNEKA